ncbi:hypothetical protein Ciccas_002082 [Cichlidogyrus casuarinus]|uniref:Pre-mRNA-splicing factor Syf1/CRNKL1-like C-terminal HAT-repeats domain-containing protein n=1 Tax=Cichlidogyrus casuarinus TaxID=1844966 RepID=A0ABD2QIL7_9PLAT
MYARLEEEHGLARRANKIYERATEAVLAEERYEMFNIFIQRVADLHGLTHTRFAYQMAIEKLPEQHARQMCVRFADLERKLGEIDRARAIYAYCSQMCDPRTETTFWNTWKEFEIAHGNEDTLREMLRIKRSVQATYNTKVSLLTGQVVQTPQENAVSSEMDKLNEAASADANVTSVTKTPLIAFHSAGIQQSVDSKIPSEAYATKNQEEIDIDDDDDDEDEDEEEPPSTTIGASGKRKLAELDQGGPSEKKILGLEKQPIPAEVFGGLRRDDDN